MPLFSPITIGTDKSVLESFGDVVGDDPSGFSQRGFDSRAIKQIMTLAENAWHTIIASISKAVSIPLPRSIPLYMKRMQDEQHYLAAALSISGNRSAADIRVTHDNDSSRVTVLRRPVDSSRGIALSLTPDMLSAEYETDLYECLINKLIHTLVYNAFASSFTFTRAFPEHLATCLVRKRDSRVFSHLSWKPEGFAETCGLRIDDFADCNGAPAFVDLVNIHTIVGLDGTDTDEMWAIAGSLISTATGTGFCPSSSTIIEAIRSVIGSERCDKILKSTLARPLREGTQLFFCPFGSELFLFCIEVQQNGRYMRAPVGAPLAWDNCQFVVGNGNSSVTIIGELGDGSTRVCQKLLTGGATTSWNGLSTILKQANEGQWVDRDLVGIRCEANGISAVMQRPPEQTVQEATR